MQIYGVIAVSFGILTPIFWTIRAYYVRLTVEDKSFDVLDMSVDTLFFQFFIALIIYLIYLAQNPFILSDFVEGNVAGFFILMGTIFNINALRFGPGGPVNALQTT